MIISGHLYVLPLWVVALAALGLLDWVVGIVVHSVRLLRAAARPEVEVLPAQGSEGTDRGVVFRP